MKQSEAVQIFGQKFIFYLRSSRVFFFLFSLCNVSWGDLNKGRSSFSQTQGLCIEKIEREKAGL